MQRYLDFVLVQKIIAFGIVFLFFLPIHLKAEKVVLEGVVLEEKSNSYLEEVKITVLDSESNVIISNLYTNAKGEFSCELEKGKSYKIKVEKEAYQKYEEMLELGAKKTKKKLSLKKKRVWESGRIAVAANFSRKNSWSNAGMLLPYLLSMAPDSLPEYWWRTKEENKKKGYTKEPFQEDIFDPQAQGSNTNTKNSRFNSSRGRATNSRGIPDSFDNSDSWRSRTGSSSRSRNSGSGRDFDSDWNRNSNRFGEPLPDSFDEKGGEANQRKIIPETEVTLKELKLEVELLDNEYTGFMVQIVNSGSELPEDDEIFQRHGNIVLENNDGQYAYLLGKFPEREQAEKFFEEALEIQYPDAKVIEYRFGRRISE